jgi:molecular chaperone GrpE
MANPFKKIFSMQDKEHSEKEQVPEQEVNNTNSTPEENPAGQTDTSATDEKAEEFRKQLEEAQKKYLYLVADFENYKRHAAKERVELIQTAGREILSSLIPILDDFERAQKNGAMSEGTTLIHHKLIHTLRTKGLSQVELKPGDDFNADTQEAVTEIPAPTEALKGKIVDILEPGYQLGERMIRFAKVVVGK